MPAKRTMRVGVVLLTGALLCSSLHPAESSVLSRLRSSLRGLWGQRATTRQQANQAYGRASNLADQADSVHDRLENTQRELIEANDVYLNYWRQMKRTESRIDVARRRLKVVTTRYDNHRTLFGKRLASMQRSGKLGYLELFLGTQTLSDLTRRVHLYQTMTRRDAELQASLRADRNELLAMRTLLDAQWSERNQLQLAANRERVRIAGVEASQSRLLSQINNSREDALAYAAAQEQSSRELSGMIQELQARRATIAREYDARAGQGGGRRVRYVRRGGELRPMPITTMEYRDELQPESGSELRDSFSQQGGDDGHDHSWGTPVRGRLSSRYGMRYHPVLHRYKLHTGDDLAAGYGTPFRAAHGGRVLWAGWKKAYGNTVIVDSGNGVTTLYGHASKLNVKVGQPVKRGDYIGNVGSTGWSTGPHLHFEVRKDGRPVDPHPYIRGK